MEQPRWTLADSMGQFSAGTLTANCSLRQPALGVLFRLTESEVPCDQAELLAPQLPSTSSPFPAGTELFARGGDLVGIYPASEDYPYRSQVYWRLDAHPWEVAGQRALAAIELVASQQTDLLDTLPVLQAISRVPARECTVLDIASGECLPIDGELASGQLYTLTGERGPCALLFRCERGFPSYAELVHPLDFTRTDIHVLPADESTNKLKANVEVRHHLFAWPLEKGVILRSRVLGLWLAPQNDVAVALAHFRQFAASEPPLTA
jgi:hypothetical protein